MRVKPKVLRPTGVVDGGGLHLTGAASRNWFIAIFLGLWLTGWSGGIFGICHNLLTSKHPDPFGGFGLLVLSAGAAWVAYAWQWNLIGYETIMLNSQELALRKTLLGWTRSQEFDRGEIQNLRTCPNPFGPWGYVTPNPWPIGGLLAFDYGARTYRFGVGVDEAEANQSWPCSRAGWLRAEAFSVVRGVVPKTTWRQH